MQTPNFFGRVRYHVEKPGLIILHVSSQVCVIPYHVRLLPKQILSPSNANPWPSSSRAADSIGIQSGRLSMAPSNLEEQTSGIYTISRGLDRLRCFSHIGAIIHTRPGNYYELQYTGFSKQLEHRYLSWLTCIRPSRTSNRNGLSPSGIS